MDRSDPQSNPTESASEFDPAGRFDSAGQFDPVGSFDAVGQSATGRRSRSTLEKLEALGNALPDDNSTVTRLPLQPFDTEPYRDRPSRSGGSPGNVTPFPRRARANARSTSPSGPLSGPMERLKAIGTDALRALRWQWPDPRSISPS
ncbi:MAG: hypothetical protein AAGF75_12605, partial [Cyanobacteria bacterium P01_H01_bin.130]